ncbi:MAG TPA: hypothetical protein VKY26_03335 [Actinomycetota bacterium]|nr:hypothetical protein [Actinomycetota bacterium]
MRSAGREPAPRRTRAASGLARVAAVLATVLATALAVLGPESPAAATFQPPAVTAAATMSSATLAAPTGLSGSCPALSSSVVLTWTATTSTFASGYAVFRSTTSGSGYGQIGTVSGRTTTTYTDTGPGGILSLGTYYYVVQAKFANWTSPNSTQASVTVLLACL